MIYLALLICCPSKKLRNNNFEGRAEEGNVNISKESDSLNELAKGDKEALITPITNIQDTSKEKNKNSNNESALYSDRSINSDSLDELAEGDKEAPTTLIENIQDTPKKENEVEDKNSLTEQFLDENSPFSDEYKENEIAKLYEVFMQVFRPMIPEEQDVLRKINNKADFDKKVKEMEKAAPRKNKKINFANTIIAYTQNKIDAKDKHLFNHLFDKLNELDFSSDNFEDEFIKISDEYEKIKNSL